MKKWLSRAVWIIALAAVAGIIVSFLIDRFVWAYVLMAFLVFYFGAIGSVYSLNNRVDQYKRGYDRYNSELNRSREEDLLR